MRSTFTLTDKRFAALLLAALLVLISLAALADEEEWDGIVVQLIEGQTVLMPEYFRIDGWDAEHIDIFEAKGIKYVRGLRTGKALIDNDQYDFPLYAEVLPKTDTPDWLLGTWQAKVTKGTFKGRTATYVFHDDGTVFADISKGNDHDMYLAEYACSGNYVRMTAGRFPELDLENERIVPRIQSSADDQFSKFQRLNDKKVKKAKTIGLRLYRNEPVINDEESIPEGAPGMRLLFDVKPGNAVDLSARIVIGDPTVAEIRYSTDGEPVLYGLKQGSTTIQAVSYNDKKVVSNTIRLTVTESEATVPEDLMGCVWVYNGDYSYPQNYVFMPDGKLYWYSIHKDGVFVKEYEYRVHGDYIVTDMENHWEMYIADAGGVKVLYGNKKEKLITGWQNINGHKVYFDERGIPAEGWFQVDGKTYYADMFCRVVTGEQEIDWETYVFDQTGALTAP